jgi:hypothetical protein
LTTAAAFGADFRHTDFLPLLVQLYVTPEEIVIWPTFLQLPPALMAALAGAGLIRVVSEATSNPINNLFISQRVATK